MTRTLLILAFAACVPLARAQAPSATQLVGWGNTRFDTRDLEGSYSLVGAGLLHTLAVKASGEVVAWGSNGDGQCNVPGGLTNVIQLGGAISTSFALRGDGTIVVWGTSANGLTNVPALPPGTSYVKVHCGGQLTTTVVEDHMVALRSDGAIVAWGNNTYGQCNVPALPPGVAAVDVSAGINHMLALLDNGQVIGWGHNGYGQTTVPSIPAGRSVVDIVAGEESSVALLDDGSLLAWGFLAYGVASPPTPPPGVRLVSIHGGVKHIVGEYDDGSTRAWGNNAIGQTELPVVPPGRSIVQVSVGNSHNVFRLDDGRVIADGGNRNYQCNAEPFAGGRRAVEVRASRYVSDMLVALMSDGFVQSWGSGAFGQLNVPALPPGVTYESVDVGFDFGYSLRSDGQLTGWGRHYEQQLVVPQPPPGVTYTGVACGYMHVAAVRSDGVALTWGSTNSSRTPPPGLQYVAIFAGYGHSIAIANDGSAIGWGLNNAGQAAVDTFPPTGGVWVKFEAGRSIWGYSRGITFGLTSLGDIIGYGEGLPELTIPPRPPGLRYVDVELGRGVVMARLSDGSRVAWGSNVDGQFAAFTDLHDLAITDETVGFRNNYALLGDPRWDRVLNHCYGNQSSSGCLPTLSASGSTSASASSGFVVTCSGVDGQRSAVLFYGLNGRTSAPWGSNSSTRLCVAAPSQRMVTADTGGSSGACDGSFSTDWLAYLAGHPTALGAPFASGISVNAQAWFRDPPAPKSTNLSDAIEFFTAP